MERYIHLKGFLSEEEQHCLSKSALERHKVCQEQKLGSEYESEWQRLETSSSSIPLNMGLKGTGGPFVDMDSVVRYSKRAFGEASRYFSSVGQGKISEAIDRLRHEEAKLTGISLLYGPNGSMLAHYDAPTQPGRHDEWLVGFTVGADTYFRCNDKIVLLKSGDALVMDSMAVLHGVESIKSGKEAIDCSLKYELPSPGSRLGVLLWQGAHTVPEVTTKDEPFEMNHTDIKTLFMIDTDSECSGEIEESS